MLALITQLAVRVVFDNWNAVLVRQPDQLPASVFGEGHAARVLEVGQDIHELRSGPQRSFEQPGLQTLSIYRNRDVLGAHQVECLQCTKVGRRFDEDAVSAIDQQLGDQVERLLRA